MELRIETKPRRGWAIPAAVIIALLLFGQSLAKFWIDYQWWRSEEHTSELQSH